MLHRTWGRRHWQLPLLPLERRVLAQSNFSDVIFDAKEDKLHEIFQKHVDSSAKSKGPEHTANVVTTRREALSLYRSILRYSKLFVWSDDRGKPWAEVLRESARKEFEAARLVSDPTMIARMLVTGRDALQQSIDKFLAKRQQIEDEAFRQNGQQGSPDPP
eukprot:jgi/Botrbrau1/7857/Bobra.9_2s0033.1